jgi:D-serine deaminase-like pyridoxal phosphate-dependent protein
MTFPPSLAAAVEALGTELLDWRFKGLPDAAYGQRVDSFLAGRPRLRDFGTPLLTLDAGCLAGNIDAMAQWCSRRGLHLAPHGKTTMAPALFQAQLAAGAWGITLANEFQVRVGRAFGIDNILMAGVLLRPAALAWLAQEQHRDAGFRFTSWVDSVDAVDQMAAAVPRGSTVDVCVELGAPGGRTGARGPEAAWEVARAVHRSQRLTLVGVSGYEGAVVHSTGAQQLAEVDRYLDELVDLHHLAEPLYDLTRVGSAVVTVGGSVYFDRVAERLGPVLDPNGTAGPPTQVVLRSGAYVAHDDGHYRGLTPSVRGDGPQLRPALHVWATVISAPEADFAVLDAGRRDLPFDSGLPEPQLRRRPDGAVSDLAGAHVSALNDQHAFLHLAPGVPVAVGDVVRLGISHPCTAFDKWTLIPELDDSGAADPAVVGLVRTFF